MLERIEVGMRFAATWSGTRVVREVVGMDRFDKLVTMRVLTGRCAGRVVTIDESELQAYLLVARQVA